MFLLGQVIMQSCRNIFEKYITEFFIPLFQQDGELATVLFTFGSSFPVARTTRSPGGAGASRSARQAGTQEGNRRGVAGLRGTGGSGGS